MKGTLSLDVVLWGDVIGRMVWDEVRQVAVFQFSERYHRMRYNLMPTRPTKPMPPFIADSLFGKISRHTAKVD